MKIVNSVLSNDLLIQIGEELQSKIQKDCWGTSEVFWQPLLNLNSTGSVLISEPSDKIKTEILSELKNNLPEYSDIHIKYHLWQKGSAISCHSDEQYKFGATLYLNKFWEINWGGIFVWKPKDSDIMKAIAPTHNTLVLNDQNEMHFVTPLAYTTDNFRATIQFFAY